MELSKLIEHSKIYQRDVYKFAETLVKKGKINSVLDIGCGYPSKLEEFIYLHLKDITGIDTQEIVDLIDVNFGKWISADLEKGEVDLKRTFDLIISSDVVEHLQNPVKLLETIKKHSHKDTLILISTPDGDTTLKKSNGKLFNKLHIREWGRETFRAFLGANKLEILESRYAVEKYDETDFYVCNYFLCRKSKQLSVLVTLPNMHWVHQHVADSLLKLRKDTRYNLTFIFPSKKPYENNQHHIVNDFMKGDYDFWLSIDADNPPTVNPLNLIELDKDIIGLPTPIWCYNEKKAKKGESPIYWNAYKYNEKEDAYNEYHPREGLQRVDAIGTGCFLIARRVFENKEMRKAPFERKLNEDGTVERGNDISFCERATEQGFEIYCHFDYLCKHFCELELGEIIKGFKNLYEK